MSRRFSTILVLVLSISLLAVQSVRAAKSYYAEYFDVQIELQEDGSAVVTETVKFHFEGDPFTFAFREVSATETDRLTFLDASMDGMPMPRGDQPGHVEVEEGDDLRVTWHFAPTSNAAHVFVVRYRADGVVRKADGDTLIWRAIPEDHDYAIQYSTITLTYPADASLQGQPILDWDFDAAWEENRVTLTAGGVPEDEDLILTANFAADSLTSATPQWQIRKEQVNAAAARAVPVGLWVGIATLVLGGLGLFTYARSQSRDLNISPVISIASPPSDLSPALVGALMKQPHTFMGALFDLARRGVIEIREEKGSWGTKNYRLLRKEHAVPLTSFEQGLLSAIFKPEETQVNMGEVAGRLATAKKRFEAPLEQELIQRGWLDPDRKQKRSRLAGIGLTALLLALALVIVTLFMGSGWSVNVELAAIFGAVAGASLAIFLLALALLIYAGTYSVLTPAGDEQAARWRGFAEYLRQVSKGKEPAIRPDYFERYLAYAAAFGLGAGWTKYFESLDGVPLPVWFHAMPGSGSNFGAMVAMMSASDSTGSAGGAGGAGASGGGSSGVG